MSVARTYPLRVLQNFIETDAKLIAPSVKKIEDEVHYLNDSQFTQEPLAQIQSTGNKEITITQEPLAQIHNVAKTVSDIYRMEIKDIEKRIYGITCCKNQLGEPCDYA